MIAFEIVVANVKFCFITLKRIKFTNLFVFRFIYLLQTQARNNIDVSSTMELALVEEIEEIS